jgi:hypothetical protein
VRARVCDARVCMSAGVHARMRVFHCSYVRKGSAFLQASRQLDVFTAMNASALEHFTEIMGVVQHHDAGVLLSGIVIVALRLPAGYLSSVPIEKYYVFATTACARRTGAASQAFERMHNTLSHRVKT